MHTQLPCDCHDISSANFLIIIINLIEIFMSNLMGLIGHLTHHTWMKPHNTHQHRQTEITRFFFLWEKKKLSMLLKDPRTYENCWFIQCDIICYILCIVCTLNSKVQTLNCIRWEHERQPNNENIKIISIIDDVATKSIELIASNILYTQISSFQANGICVQCMTYLSDTT